MNWAWATVFLGGFVLVGFVFYRLTEPDVDPTPGELSRREPEPEELEDE